jgi:hypothetical protein
MAPSCMKKTGCWVIVGLFAGRWFPADRLNYFCQRAAKTQPPEAEQLLLIFNL